MTTETLGVLRMRRDTLTRDLKALNRGEAGQFISAAQTRFYTTRIAAINHRLTRAAG